MEENKIGNSIFKFERDAGIDSKMATGDFVQKS